MMRYLRWVIVGWLWIYAGVCFVKGELISFIGWFDTQPEREAILVLTVLICVLAWLSDVRDRML